MYIYILQKYTNLFQKGFSFANQNLLLFVVQTVPALFIFFINTSLRAPNNFLTVPQPSLFYGLINWLLQIISFGIVYTLPIFFLKRYNHGKYTIAEVIAEIVATARNLFLPLLGLLAITIIFAFLNGVILNLFMKLPSLLSNVTVSFSIFTVQSIIFRILNAMLIFSPLLYKLEKLNFYPALFDSFKLSLKHLLFIAIVLGFNYFLTLLDKFILPSPLRHYSIFMMTSYEELLRQLFGLLIGNYLGFILTATVFVYYKKYAANR